VGTGIELTAPSWAEGGRRKSYSTETHSHSSSSAGENRAQRRKQIVAENPEATRARNKLLDTGKRGKYYEQIRERSTRDRGGKRNFP